MGVLIIAILFKISEGVKTVEEGGKNKDPFIFLVVRIV